MGLSFAQLLDFAQATGGLYIKKSGQDFENDASQNTQFWWKLADGLGDKLYVNGGKGIHRPIAFHDNGTFREYGKGDNFQPVSVDVMETMQEWMRQADTHWTIRDEEWLYNEGRGGDGEFHQFFNLIESKRAMAKTSMFSGIDNQLFAVPDKTLMEGDTSIAVSPKSFFAYINEYPNGLYQNGPGGTWTVKSGLDPTDPNISPGWDHQRSTYASETIGTYGTMLEGLDELLDNMNWEQPSSYQQYFSNPMMSKCFLLTSTVGRTAFKFLNRTGQDNWTRFGEGGLPDTTHNGIPIYRAKQMDTAPVWHDGSSANTTEALADLSGPRVIGINGAFMHPVCHADRTFHEDGPLRDISDPDMYVFRDILFWTLVCTSLRHQGLLEPSADGMYYPSS